MSTHVCDWRIELINAHRSLFRPPAKAPVIAQGYPNCGPGWRDVLNTACLRIRMALSAEEHVEIQQIKAKHGTLRVYWQGKLSTKSRIKVEEAVALMEARSACTCEACGQEGRLYRKGGAFMTRCKSHAQGEPVPVKHWLENIPLVRVGEIPDVRAFTCRRYDRASDSFVEIDPSSLAIEEA
jgi:hypothetical protein